MADLHSILERCCSDVPPRIRLEAMLSAPVWLVVEQVAEELLRHHAAGLDSAVGAGPPPHPPYLDAQTTALVEFLLAITDNLVSCVLSLPVISSATHRPAMLQCWRDMAAAYFASCTAGRGGGGEG